MDHSRMRVSGAGALVGLGVDLFPFQVVSEVTPEVGEIEFTLQGQGHDHVASLALEGLPAHNPHRTELVHDGGVRRARGGKI